MSHQFFNLVQRIADELEPWKRDHEEVMDNWKRADALSEGVAFYLFFLSRVDEFAAPKDRERIHMMNLTWADLVCDAYEGWYNHASDLLAVVDDCEHEDFPVKQSSELRDALQRVGQMLPDMSLLRQQIKDFREGKCISLKEALNGMGSLSARRG